MSFEWFYTRKTLKQHYVLLLCRASNARHGNSMLCLLYVIPPLNPSNNTACGDNGCYLTLLCKCHVSPFHMLCNEIGLTITYLMLTVTSALNELFTDAVSPATISSLLAMSYHPSINPPERCKLWFILSRDGPD